MTTLPPRAARHHHSKQIHEDSAELDPAVSQGTLPCHAREVIQSDHVLETRRRDARNTQAAEATTERRRGLDQVSRRQARVQGVYRSESGYRHQDAEGEFVSWSELDHQLDRIEKYGSRIGFWTDPKPLAALEAVKVQTFGAPELGSLDDVIPSWMRGRFNFTPTQWRLVCAAYKAYRFESGGVAERQAVLAADFDLSRTALYYAMAGRTNPPRKDGTRTRRLGLIELGVLSVRLMRRKGTDGRKSDDWLLLIRFGPVMEDLVRPTMAANDWIDASDGQRIAARKALSKLRHEARARRAKAGRDAWHRAYNHVSFKRRSQCEHLQVSPPFEGGRGETRRGRRGKPLPCSSPPPPIASVNPEEIPEFERNSPQTPKGTRSARKLNPRNAAAEPTLQPQRPTEPAATEPSRGTQRPEGDVSADLGDLFRSIAGGESARWPSSGPAGSAGPKDGGHFGRVKAAAELERKRESARAPPK